MKISEVEANKKIGDMTVEIQKLDEPSQTHYGKKFQEGIVADETGQIKITFWDEEAEKFSINQKIYVRSGFCKSYKDELQISSGKFGKIELVK